MNNLTGKTIKEYSISPLKVSITFSDNTTFWVEPTDVYETLECGMNMEVKTNEIRTLPVVQRTTEI